MDSCGTPRLPAASAGLRKIAPATAQIIAAAGKAAAVAENMSFGEPRWKGAPSHTKARPVTADASVAVRKHASISETKGSVNPSSPWMKGGVYFLSAERTL